MVDYLGTLSCLAAPEQTEQNLENTYNKAQQRLRGTVNILEDCPQFKNGETHMTHARY
jgi:hypothetical protein